MNDKRALRRHLRQLRRALAPRQREQAGHSLQQQISQRWPAQVLAAYVSHGDEVPTMPLLTAYWQAGRGVWLPLVVDACLHWCYVTGPQQLRSGYRGILEPDQQSSPAQDMPGDASLMLVPGLGFTRSGARLGQGGGFYDRVLPACRARGMRVLGVAFACQLLADLPMQEHDICVDEVLICDG